MKIQIGSVTLNVTIAKVGGSTAFGIELDIPLGGNKAHIYIDYAEKAIEPLRINLTIRNEDE